MRERPHVVLFTLVVGYAAFYLCRANVEAAFPLLKQSFSFTKTQLGLLSSVPIAAYALGKVLMGALGDLIGGKRLIVLAIAGSVAATFAFGASGALGAFILCASANRFFQSGGWSGAVHVISRRFEPRRHGLVMGIMSTSYELGNVLALLLCSAITLRLRGWRPLFVVNPLLLAAVGLFVVLALPAGGPLPATPEAAASLGVQDDPSLADIVRSLARKPALWIAVALSVLLTFLRIGFLTWTPMYLYEVSHATDISGSIAKAAFFSSAGVVAALSTGALSDRFGPGRRAPVMTGSLAVVVVLVLVLAHCSGRTRCSRARWRWTSRASAVRRPPPASSMGRGTSARAPPAWSWASSPKSEVGPRHSTRPPRWHSSPRSSRARGRLPSCDDERRRRRLRDARVSDSPR